ncbi:hypothetical protein M011DRAFT_4473 [Sporormia fimetaria CBS 119925]|uniref:Uncharacterized protein n=1 Tax=Sporormia fimetaria CBS 119925 TaxID=1340428 RepID=A0A6A6VPG1_9PLEO|nr:hypothetical protein M011DRAFT_4473 [Sporormia fimetaria CBS 119925]
MGKIQCPGMTDLSCGECNPSFAMHPDWALKTPKYQIRSRYPAQVQPLSAISKPELPPELKLKVHSAPGPPAALCRRGAAPAGVNALQERQKDMRRKREPNSRRSQKEDDTRAADSAVQGDYLLPLTCLCGQPLRHEGVVIDHDNRSCFLDLYRPKKNARDTRGPRGGVVAPIHEWQARRGQGHWQHAAQHSSHAFADAGTAPGHAGFASSFPCCRQILDGERSAWYCKVIFSPVPLQQYSHGFVPLLQPPRTS